MWTEAVGMARTPQKRPAKGVDARVTREVGNQELLTDSMLIPGTPPPPCCGPSIRKCLASRAALQLLDLHQLQERSLGPRGVLLNLQTNKNTHTVSPTPATQSPIHLRVFFPSLLI